MSPSPQITVIVPAYNEAANLPECVAVLRSTFSTVRCEILIVNDGSADDTWGVAQKLAAEPQLAAEQAVLIRAITHDKNRGFGAAMRTGFDNATGEYVMCCPADFQMTREDWAPFEQALGKADVLVGCRERRVGYNLLMRFNSWLYPWLVWLLFGLRLRDVNWISIYRGEMVKRCPITQNGIPMLTEILVRLRDLGATFLEVDCKMQLRTKGVPSASRFKVMYKTLLGLFQFRWSY
jgi:dolichol-phosphate mannosyltransferase